MTVFLQTPIFGWRGSRRVLQQMWGEEGIMRSESGWQAAPGSVFRWRGRHRFLQPSGSAEAEIRSGFMTVFLQTPIFSWRGRRRVLQPLGAHKTRCVQVGEEYVASRFRFSVVKSGSHLGCRRRDAQRVEEDATSRLQFAQAAVESGGLSELQTQRCGKATLRRGCLQAPIFSSRWQAAIWAAIRGAEAEQAVASSLRSSVRAGKRRIQQPAGV